MTQKKPLSVQDSLPFMDMYPDGICRISKCSWSGSILIRDRNYITLSERERKQIFDQWCGLLNYADPEINLQFSFISLHNPNPYLTNTGIKNRANKDNVLTKELNSLIKTNVEDATGGMVSYILLTLGINAPTAEQARMKIRETSGDFMAILINMGANPKILTGEERLYIMHMLMNRENNACFDFSWDYIKNGRLTVKDCIAPQRMEFVNAGDSKIGSNCVSVSYFQITSPTLGDNIISELESLGLDCTITMHIRSIENAKAIKNVKRKMTDIQKSKIDEQKKAVRSGYDMDIIPSDINTYNEGASRLLNDLQNNNERMFLLTFLIANYGENRKKLNEYRTRLSAIALKHNCSFVPLDFIQEDSFMSTLPIGINLLDIHRIMTTSSLAVMTPFATKELCKKTGQNIYYGFNTISGNPISIDRSDLRNPNGLILGASGSGKSMAAKFECLQAFLGTNSQILIVDPEGEWTKLVRALGGEETELGPGSASHINPLDLNFGYTSDDDPLRLKTDFVLSMFEIMKGKGLSPIEKSVTDRCIRTVYGNYIGNPLANKPPLLADLSDVLKNQPEREAANLASIMEIYVTGSLNMFNHPTNVNIDNRLMNFNIRSLGTHMKSLGMLIVDDHINNAVANNRHKKEKTYIYIDEMHLMLRTEQTSAYMVELWKRLRKYGGIPTGITQDITDLMSSPEIGSILENTSFYQLFAQGRENTRILTDKMNLSDREAEIMANLHRGSGILIAGEDRILLSNPIPNGTKLYSVMTTKHGET